MVGGIFGWRKTGGGCNYSKEIFPFLFVCLIIKMTGNLGFMSLEPRILERYNFHFYFLLFFWIKKIWYSTKVNFNSRNINSILCLSDCIYLSIYLYIYIYIYIQLAYHMYLKVFKKLPNLKIFYIIFIISIFLYLTHWKTAFNSH